MPCTVYYDNVGGEQLEAAIYSLKDWGRIGETFPKISLFSDR